MESLALDALSERQQRVLRIVIQEYVHTAQPVASGAIVNHSDLGVSPATIRNELAALEKMGLLTHPHTSAGRIPTDLGYRYFVHHLMADSTLGVEEQTAIRRRLSEVRQDVDQWLRVGTSVLAKASQGAAVATAPRSSRSIFKHMELVAIHGTKVLLVMVLQEGTVKQQLLDLDLPMEQSELTLASNELNYRLIGADAAAVEGIWHRLSPFARQVAVVVKEAMQRVDSQISGQLFRDGLAEVLQAPEFAEGENVRRIVRVLEEPSLLEQILGQQPDGRAVQVVIAGDGRYEELRDVSLVLTRYGSSDGLSGMLGVVGPVRMPYSRTIGAVRFVSDIMSELMEDLYGGPPAGGSSGDSSTPGA